MLSPLPQYKLIQTAGSDSFKKMGAWETGLPLFGHCGSFGFRRKFHFHEGLDFYVPERTSVYACEPGEVLAITAFTGQHANCPWWAETWGVLVEGETGVFCYGEILPHSSIKIGKRLLAGDIIGEVKTVLLKDKGRPMSMLHLELHKHGTVKTHGWYPETGKPESLLDPTSYFIDLAEKKDGF